MNVWKYVQQLGRSLPFKKKEPTEKKMLDDGGEPIIQYGCDVCSNGIQEGSPRYHCGECAASYDLCSSCYDNGEGTKHTETFGYLHELHMETKNELALARNVFSETLEQSILNMFSMFSERPSIGVYVASRNRYEYLKFRELGKLVADFGLALHSRASFSTSSSPPMVALCSVVRLEWYIADYACLLLGIPTVGITAFSDTKTISFILSQTESAIAICSLNLYPVFLSLAEQSCPHVKEIVVMDLDENEDVDINLLTKPQRSDLRVTLFSDMIVSGSNDPVDLSIFRPDPDGIFTIAYTSGSTGDPKGCVFTRKHWLSRLNVPLAFLFGTKRVWFSFQPPSHMMERESLHLTLVCGNKAGIYRGSMEHLFDDLRMVRPTVITSTPRFYATIYNEYLHELQQEYLRCYKVLQLHLVEEAKKSETTQISDSQEAVIPEAPPIPSEFPKRRAVTAETESSDLYLDLPSEFDPFNLPYPLRNKVREKFKNYFGGRERVLAVGGAAVPKELKRFMSFCFDALVSEGYGTTEVGGICNANWCTSNGVLIKLKDVPEMGYLTTDKPPRGEICVKTDSMIEGYYKNSHETTEKFQDGFFCTGDIGVMDVPGHVIIIDRKKNIFKLAQGEFVAPEKIEGLYESTSNFMEQVYVYGNIYRNNVLAVIVPHAPALIKWKLKQQTEDKSGTNDNELEQTEAKSNDNSAANNEETVGSSRASSEPDTDVQEICLLPEVHDLVMSELRTVGQANGLQGWEIPAGIVLEPNPFTVENNLLTCTMKKSRPKLERKYKAKLEQLYDELESTDKTRLAATMSIEEEILNTFLVELASKGIDLSGMDHMSVCPSTQIDLSLSLTQLGGDSMSAMHLSNLLSSHFHLEIPALTILKEPLANILLIVSNALSHNSNPFTTSQAVSAAVDWDEEIDISFLENMSTDSNAVLPKSTSSSDHAVVLLTGATGFLGRFLLWELLNNSNVEKVYCLVRNSSSDEPASCHVLNIIKQLSIEFEVDTFDGMMAKLAVLESDLSKPDLGLSENDYSIVKTEVDLVIHNGAHVNHILKYNDLKQTNVNSTKELLKLCRLSRTKILHYVSTIGVFAALPWETIDETSTTGKARLGILSGYSQSKWVCEQMILQAIKNGLICQNSCISRPGLIGAHSVTGHFNRTDWFYMMVQGLKQLKCYPNGGAWSTGIVDIIPVDVTAKSIVAISCHCRSHDYRPMNSIHTYHLCNTDAQGFVTMQDVVQALKKNCDDLDQMESIDQEIFLTILSEKAKMATASPNIIALYLLLGQGYCPFSSNGVKFNNKITDDVLRPLGVNVNVPLIECLDRYMNYLISH